MKEFEEIKTAIASAEADMEKTEEGNAAAGRRVRKAMQEVKKLAQAVRNNVTALKKA